MRVLGVETSCDETAAAVVDGGSHLITNIVHSQRDVHAGFGGVVPEIASREHVAWVMEVVQQAVAPVGGIQTVQGLAVTRGPGLVGCLLVGLQFVKGLALAYQVPWVGIHHLEGHMSAALLDTDPPAYPPAYPHVALVVSGGHTHLYHVRAFGDYLLLGGTRDDAAGEAFDKVAKILGLGYPGGVRIQQVAQGGDPHAVALPRAWMGQGFDFSFSGLKTAAHAFVQAHGGRLHGALLSHFCASLQEAIADVLTHKAVRAAQQVGAPGVVLAGGVAANERLRDMLAARCNQAGLWSFAPPPSLCTDNAAMIAAAGWKRLQAGECTPWQASAVSRWPLGDRHAYGSWVKPWLAHPKQRGPEADPPEADPPEVDPKGAPLP